VLPQPHDRTWTPAEAELAIRAAFPGLALGVLRHLGRGWDADVFCDDEWCFRFARNELAARGMLREPALLGWLSTVLPLRIPCPLHCATLDDGRTALLSSPLIHGETVCDARLGRAARAALAPPLGQFIRALHALDPQAAPLPLEAADASIADDQERRAGSRERLARLELTGVLDAWLSSALAHLLAAPLPPADGDERVVHGDLHSRNLLSHAGALAGVIDWVDVHAGEPARDLASAFMVLPPEAHPSFLAAHGPVAPHTWQRASFRALVHMIATLDQAGERGDHAFAAATLVALRELAERA
jgi:aminoglycoside phosphotransferase (APT) family kinase protein